MRFLKYILIVAFFVLSSSLFSQVRLVMNNDIFIVFNSVANLVIENGNSNAITQSGTGGNIISENENGLIHWQIGNNTGNYIIPFTTQSIVNGGNEIKIPLEINITSPGDAGGELSISTYETSTDLNIPWATDVTHMNNDVLSNNSLFVVDRFWIINPESFTTLPNVELSIGYDQSANEMVGTNTIIEANLFAQRFNSILNIWGDFFDGTVNTATNKVENIIVLASDFKKVWTLVDNSSSLPVELISFKGNCYQNKINFNWKTASESNSQSFILESSWDAQNWQTVDQINAAGNSNQIIEYELTVSQQSQAVYYRLKILDLNGEFAYSEILLVDCNNQNDEVIVFPNPAMDFILLNSTKELIGSDFFVFDNIGKLIYSSKFETDSKTIDIKNWATGLYFIQVQNESRFINFKFMKL